MSSVGEINVTTSELSKLLTEDLKSSASKSSDGSEPVQQKTDENKLAQYSFDINGEIEASKQGLLNDCGTLSGINSLSFTEEGKRVIKNAISLDDKGNVVVYFKGVDKKYTITPEEMKNSNASFGDDDVKALEIAVRKFRTDVLNSNIEIDEKLPDCAYSTGRASFPKEGENFNGDPLEGGDGRQIMFLLTGKEPEMFSSRILNKAAYTDKGKEYKKDFENYIKDFEKHPEKYAATASFKYYENENNIVAMHEYAIKKIDKDNIILVNPWFSSEETVISREEFDKYFDMVNFCKIERGFFEKIGDFFSGN